MGKLNITELFIYRWRYQIGYGVVAIGLIAMLILAGLYSPGGLSTQEMQSVVKSSSINYADLNSFTITNMPYHVLQQLTLAIFGVSILSIKLPSIILAFASITGMVLLLRRWFKPRIGILASLIAITTGQFVFIAQDGTPGILYLFWSVWLILLADLISRQETHRTFNIIVFSILAALSLYTPLSVYVLIALIVAVLLHPHLRYIVKHLSRPKIIAGLVAAILLTVPLMMAITKSPELGLTLLGIPSTWPDFGANMASLGAQYLGFAKPGGSTIMTPFFELGSMLLVFFGIAHTIQTRSYAKSYVIILWVLCLIPFIVINPDFTSITYLPMVILLASGLGTLLASWYVLFPRNPYARIGGLIPVVILVSVLVLSGVDRYIYGYRYDPSIAPNFSTDLRLLPKDTTQLIVGDNELGFYQVVASHNKNIELIGSPAGDSFTASHNGKQNFDGYTIDHIVTSPRVSDGDRFYFYKKIVK